MRAASPICAVAEATKKKSIRELPPLESGGVTARRGFAFQDHVAAGFLLEMAESAELLEVWCEAQDDITLILDDDGTETAEFVQVKSDEFGHFWSVAELCKPTKWGKNNGPSILERSLAHDRGREHSRFRMVTTVRPNKDLQVLAKDPDGPERTGEAPKIKSLKDALAGKTSMTSPNRNDSAYWVENTRWDTRHDTASVRAANLLALARFVESEDLFLAHDQLEELYQKLLAKAQQAAEAEWGASGEAKKIVGGAILNWLVQHIEDIAHPGKTLGGAKLRSKMGLALLPRDMIESAALLKWRYRQTSLQPDYRQRREWKEMESAILHLLLRLRSDLDAEKMEDDGIQFHATCLQRLEDARQAAVNAGSENVPPSHAWSGCMYSITDRCAHRFRRATQ